MSNRRPAEGPPNGSPDPKKPRIDAPSATPPAALSIEAIKAQMAARKAAAAQSASGSSKASSPAMALPPGSVRVAPVMGTGAVSDDVAARLAAAKARIEAMNKAASAQATTSALPPRPANPYMSGSSASASTAAAAGAAAPAAGPSATSRQTASPGLHPLLAAESAAQQKEEEQNEKRKERDRYKTMAPKFSTVRANQAVVQSAAQVRPVAAAPVLNPYASGGATQSGSASPAPDEERIVERKSRKMHFSAAGKYVKQGDVIRAEAKMEALRQRIAEASRKAGLDSEFDVLERSLRRRPPPDVEWWDQAILPEGHTYEDIDKALKWNLQSKDTLINHLVQHPIPIAAATDKKPAEPGLRLTKKEQKKMRRQRRRAELEDKQDRQKMGLIPPDPPKVRLANLMKVLTSDAVQDPTKVEARVRKEVAARANKHERENQDRKLTAEERKEKEYQKMVDRERRGIWATVYKIKYLTNGRHIFKVKQTAKSDLLSGVCVFSPNFALVLVEGVDKGIKHFRQLMTNRIDWTEEARPLGDGEKDGAGSDGEFEAKKNEVKPAEGSMSENLCEAIWEGEVSERTFKVFRPRHAESDSKAKEWLTPKWEGMWDLAKRHVWRGDDL